LRNDSRASILFLTTVLLLSGIPTDLVEDDAVVFSFNDRQAVRTPLRRTLLAKLPPRPFQRVEVRGRYSNRLDRLKRLLPDTFRIR
jgi:hypothetical protein